MTNKDKFPLPNKNEGKNLYKIENFDPKDQAEVEEFLRKASEELGWPYNPELDFDWNKINEVYIVPGGVFYVVKVNGRIIACAGLKKKGEVAELKRNRVVGEFRGQGIGHALFEKRMEFARSHGFKKVIFDTENSIIENWGLESGFKKVRQEGSKKFYEKDL